MAITYINGPEKSGKSLIANALRNLQISQSNPEEGVLMGALLIDDTNDGEPKPLVEKLLVAIELPDPVPEDLSKLPWKKDPLVIVVGKAGRAKLAEIENLVPGFTKFMGPARTLTTDTLPA